MTFTIILFYHCEPNTNSIRQLQCHSLSGIADVLPLIMKPEECLFGSVCAQPYALKLLTNTKLRNLFENF